MSYVVKLSKKRFNAPPEPVGYLKCNEWGDMHTMTCVPGIMEASKLPYLSTAYEFKDRVQPLGYQAVALSLNDALEAEYKALEENE